jgi:hypothetical protein
MLNHITLYKIFVTRLLNSEFDSTKKKCGNIECIFLSNAESYTTLLNYKIKLSQETEKKLLVNPRVRDLLASTIPFLQNYLKCSKPREDYISDILQTRVD